MTDGYTFTASDGKRYRTTGEFRPALESDYSVGALAWKPDGGADVRRCTSDLPRIIVTPVQQTYEFRLLLTEERVDFHRSNKCAPYEHSPEETAVHQGIDNKTYRIIDN